MNKSAAIATIILMAAALFLSEVSATALVAVQGGDWIEYKVTVTGNPAPIHNITWARLDVKSVLDSTIYTDIETMLANGTLWFEPDTNFNVATGVVGEGAIIPTNLTVGDVYFSQYEGNLTVTGTQELWVAGAPRTVLTGEANNTSFCWDKQTGVMVKATTVLDDCTVYSEALATNLWEQKIFGLDSEARYLLVGLVAVAGVVVGFALRVVGQRRAKVRNCELPKKP